MQYRPMLVAMDAERLAALPVGGHQALAQAVLGHVSLWFAAHGHDMRLRDQVSSAHVPLAGPSGPLLAAALDLYDAFALSPEGRQAIADFLGEPVFQEPKSE